MPIDPAPLENLASAFGFDLAVAAELGAEAKGIEIVTLDAPSESIGLPKSIPVALIRGDKPDARSLSTFFENYRIHPSRKTGQAGAQTFESFIELVNRHKTEDSVIFADMDWRKPSLTAVIDYHENKARGQAWHGKHRVHYAYPLSEEWKKWIEMNGEPMKQADFAFFLEDRVPELSSPTDSERILFERDFATTIATPAQLVELSRGLRVHVDTRVKGSVTLASGEGQIQWEESHQDGDGKPLKVPGLFMLYIAPFFMGDRIRIPVRLRYRVTGQQTSWFYQIYRPDQHITEHVRETLLSARRETGLPAYEGTPEMAL